MDPNKPSQNSIVNRTAANPTGATPTEAIQVDKSRRKTFGDQKISIALVGDFGLSRSHTILKCMIRRYGGMVSERVTAETSHLVVSLSAFKEGHYLVELARKEKAKIVTYDWLEDSMLHRTRADETQYHPSVALQSRAESRRNRKDAIRKLVDAARLTLGEQAAKNSFSKGKGDAVDDLGSDNWHVYRDSTSFLYSIVLYRAHKTGYADWFELKLYECNDGPPFAYTAYAKYFNTTPLEVLDSSILSAKGIGLTQTQAACSHAGTGRMLVPLGSSFMAAYDAFRCFFELQTGCVWEYRAWNVPRFSYGKKGSFERADAAKKLGVIGPGGEGCPSLSSSRGVCCFPGVRHESNTGKSRLGRDKLPVKGKLTKPDRALRASNILLRYRTPVTPNMPISVDFKPGFWNDEFSLNSMGASNGYALNSKGASSNVPLNTSCIGEDATADVKDNYFAYDLPEIGQPTGIMGLAWKGATQFGLEGLHCIEDPEGMTVEQRSDGDQHATKRRKRVGGDVITSVDASEAVDLTPGQHGISGSTSGSRAGSIGPGSGAGKPKSRLEKRIELASRTSEEAMRQYMAYEPREFSFRP